MNDENSSNNPSDVEVLCAVATILRESARAAKSTVAPNSTIEKYCADMQYLAGRVDGIAHAIQLFDEEAEQS